MLRSCSLGLASLLAFAAAPAVAQQTAPVENPSPPAAGTPADVPHLEVITVKVQNGYRASKIIGATVYNEQDQQVGAVDDLILSKEDKVVMAAISVGGFLGIGSKLVAIPFEKLQVDQAGKVIVSNATKDELKAMPSLTYSH